MHIQVLKPDQVGSYQPSSAAVGVLLLEAAQEQGWSNLEINADGTVQLVHHRRDAGAGRLQGLRHARSRRVVADGRVLLRPRPANG
jgi:hypothetical protein